ncbi:hypothetical protein ASE20_14785 [Nocardioides sp. Root240]|nr:hypothetical protein ASE20_14785 [Nocardioides sp. Root240]
MSQVERVGQCPSGRADAFAAGDGDLVQRQIADAGGAVAAGVDQLRPTTPYGHRARLGLGVAGEHVGPGEEDLECLDLDLSALGHEVLGARQQHGGCSGRGVRGHGFILLERLFER